MGTEAENAVGDSTGAKELTVGKFAAILFGPAAILLAVFVAVSLLSCGDNCETVIAGVVFWGSSQRSLWGSDLPSMG